MKPTGIELWLCDDCTMVAVNDDSTGIESEKRERTVRAAVAAMGPCLTPWSVDFDTNDPDDCDELEFTWSECDCCGSTLGGHRTRFTILEE